MQTLWLVLCNHRDWMSFCELKWNQVIVVLFVIIWKVSCNTVRQHRRSQSLVTSSLLTLVNCTSVWKVPVKYFRLSWVTLTAILHTVSFWQHWWCPSFELAAKHCSLLQNANNVNVVAPQNVIYLLRIEDVINRSRSFSSVAELSSAPIDSVVEVVSSESHLEPAAIETRTQQLAVSASSGRPKRGRKRKHLETSVEWKSQENANKQYTTKEDKTVEPKVFSHDFTCCCQVTDKNP